MPANQQFGKANHDSLGAGECSAGPTAAALANAIHDALGIRPRALPFDADQLMRAAQAQPG